MLIFPKIFDDITIDMTWDDVRKLTDPKYKIWCETDEKLRAVLTDLETTTFVTWPSGVKPTEFVPKCGVPVGLFIRGKYLGFDTSREYYDKATDYYKIRFAEKKPPLGLKPRYVHDTDRIADIRDAITRYIDEKMDIPWEWIQELRELEFRHFDKSE